MRLLLDTQVAIWALADPGRWSPQSQALIVDESNAIYVSAVSVWEIAINFALAKRVGAPPFSGSVALNAFSEAGFEILDVTAQHAVAVEALTRLHADPFDRILVAQLYASRFEC